MKTKVIARIYIRAEFIESFKKQAAEIVQKTRKEPGCLFYSLFQEVSSPGEFLFYEEYVDRAAYDIHSNSEHLNGFRVSTRPMRSKDGIVDVI